MDAEGWVALGALVVGAGGLVQGWRAGHRADRSQETANKAQHIAKQALREAQYGPTRDRQLRRVEDLGRFNSRLQSLLTRVQDLLADIPQGAASVEDLRGLLGEWEHLGNQMAALDTNDPRLQTLMQDLQHHSSTYTAPNTGPVPSLVECQSYIEGVAQREAAPSEGERTMLLRKEGVWHDRARNSLAHPLETCAAIGSRVSEIARHGLGPAPPPTP